jgi:hypothetical protein
MFLIEVVGLIGIGRRGWDLGGSTGTRLMLAAAFVLVASGVWTLFRTRGFVPSGGEPVVAIPGPVRVLIEVGFYVFGAWGLWVSGWEVAAVVFAISVVIVIIALRDRYARLLGNRGVPD